MDELEDKSQYFLWDARLPYGGFSLLEGRKGTGKSTLACALAAALTAGRRLPGRTGRERASVLWGLAEDDAAKTLKPRLEAAGADLSRIHRIGRDDLRRRRLVLPDDAEELGRLCVARGARLVIIEPIASFVRPGINLKDETDARLALEPFHQISQELDVCFLGQRHVRKGEGNALDAGLGSVAVGNLARSILRIDKVPQSPGQHVIWRVAGNLAADPPALSFTVENVGGVPRVNWGKEFDLDAERLAADQDAATKDVMGDAARLLQSKLKTHRVKYTDLLLEAQSGGISERTLRAAKARLGVVSYRRCKKGQAWWEWGPPRDGWPE